MLHSLFMFLAPQPTLQATPISPPAVAAPARRRFRLRIDLRFVLAMVGNVIGVGAMLGGCWLCLQLMQALLAH
jgi:hypothetical protein